MSDFDKEAEREKLRKKYARDEQKRANTQRMSELLLKGATMTNQHCNQCGDPVFRHNGQTFCARCQADAAQQANADANSEAGTNTAGADSAQPDAVEPGAIEQSAATQSVAERNAAESGAAEQRSDSTAEGKATATETSRSGQASDTARAALASQTAPTGDLSAARDSLVQTVTRFAQQAAATEDPRRARELLSAAREAAETLDALD